MGYFANLYLIEMDAVAEETVSLTTTIFCGESEPAPFFSWIRDDRSGLENEYANGTIFSDAKLRPLSGYPIVETQDLAQSQRLGRDGFQTRAQFTPRAKESPTVVHVVLPAYFIPRKDLGVLQPGPPFVKLKDNRLILTWATRDSIDLAFWSSRLKPRETFDQYDLDRITFADDVRVARQGMEINLGFVKFKFG